MNRVMVFIAVLVASSVLAYSQGGLVKLWELRGMNITPMSVTIACDGSVVINIVNPSYDLSAYKRVLEYLATNAFLAYVGTNFIVSSDRSTLLLLRDSSLMRIDVCSGRVVDSVSLDTFTPQDSTVELKSAHKILEWSMRHSRAGFVKLIKPENLVWHCPSKKRSVV